MPATQYTYEIATDFPSAKVDTSKLVMEIVDSTILIALDFIDTDASECNIWMKDAISAGDKTTLDGIVAAHDGDPLPGATQSVEVKEEDIPTGGHFQAQSVQVSVEATTGWYENTISFPFPISILTAEYAGHPDFDGDEGEFLIGPDTITGAITADSAANDTTFTVDQTVIDNAAIGFYYKVGGEDIGRCTSIDKVNMTITCEGPAPSAHLVATPTYIQQTVKVGDTIKFTHEGVVSVGSSKIGGSYIPANTVIKLRYHNLLGGTARKFNVLLEYLY